MICYLTSLAAEEQMKINPEEMKKGMEPWIALYQKRSKALVYPRTLGKCNKLY